MTNKLWCVFQRCTLKNRHNSNQEFENCLLDIDRILDVDPEEKRAKMNHCQPAVWHVITCALKITIVHLQNWNGKLNEFRVVDEITENSWIDIRRNSLQPKVWTFVGITQSTLFGIRFFSHTRNSLTTPTGLYAMLQLKFKFQTHRTDAAYGHNACSGKNWNIHIRDKKPCS